MLTYEEIQVFQSSLADVRDAIDGAGSEIGDNRIPQAEGAIESALETLNGILAELAGLR